MSYILAFLGIAALIFVHELGHFAAAKAVGMRVERFSLFFGPMIVKFRLGETEYGIGTIPLGGYAKISGMNPEEELAPEIAPRAYCNQPVWKRVVVVAAGPAVNLLVAFVIGWVILVADGQYLYDQHNNPVPSTTIGAVSAGSPAARVLEPGDRIVAIDGVKGSDSTLRAVIAADRCAGTLVSGCTAAKPLRVAVARNGRDLTVSVTPRYEATDKRMLLGIAFAQEHVSVSPLSAIGKSGSYVWQVASNTVSTVAKVFQSKERRQLHSVVGIYSYTQQYFSQGPSVALEFLALISLALAIINLFPFLPLDGGHIFWALVEKVRGRRVPLAVMERASLVGVVLIVMLVAVGLSNDLSALFGKGLVLPK